MRVVTLLFCSCVFAVGSFLGCSSDDTADPGSTGGRTGNTGGTSGNTGGTTGNTGGTTGNTGGGTATTGGSTGGPCSAVNPCGATEECVDGTCLLKNGQTCTENAKCVNACIDGKCADRADVLGTCDHMGTGGQGGEGGGAAGAPPDAGEVGSGDDADCLDGMVCDAGTCRRKLGTDCAVDDHCFSRECHRNKCVPTEPGTCAPDPSAPYCNPATLDENNMCSAGATPPAVFANACSAGRVPRMTCVAQVFEKFSVCGASCECVFN